MMKRTIGILAAAILALTAVPLMGCGESAESFILLEKGWVNTPTDRNDPYRQYIVDNYGLDITLNATTDFDNAAVVGFSSKKNRPDLISFPDYTSFRKFFKQNVLLDDWTPYLKYLPNFSKMMNTSSQENSKKVLTVDGKLTALWTPADPPVWSLKLREDWLKEFRTDKGYQADWAPETPDQLLEFARWIKVAKNEDQNNLDVFAFTGDGGGNSLGVLGTWLPLMFGAVSIAPYGFYMDENGEAAFSTTDGSYKKTLDYLKIICEEQLIEPQWYSQSFSDKRRSYQGKIGIEWLPGNVSDYTQTEFTDSEGEIIKDTTDWWETYDLPVDPEATNDRAGNMPGTGLAGKVLTVSKKTALNEEKMKKICKLIDDCYCYYDEENDTYTRGAAYDALRWGVGVEEGLVYQKIEDTNLNYINTSSVTAGREKYYRERQTGAWDWGAWFSSSNDGIVSGNKASIDKLILKVADHNIKTANMKSLPQIGEYVELDSADLNEMVSDMVAFEYNYATGTKNQSAAELRKRYDDYIQKWRTTLKGNEFLAQAKAQFLELGIA